MPYFNDTIYSPTIREHYIFDSILKPKEIDHISRGFGDDLYLGAKYYPLEHLIKMDCCDFFLVEEDEGPFYTFAVVFGHYTYKKKLESYADEAVASNRAIENEFDIKAKLWASTHSKHPMARARAKAWRDYMTFKDNVVCMDFPHAMTVHKSQGSTYTDVYIDTQDLGLCANKDYQTYLKLLYVAISRASNKVYTN